MPDFELLSDDDLVEIEKVRCEQGRIPALRMAVKKLQGYAQDKVLPAAFGYASFGDMTKGVLTRKSDSEARSLPEGD